MQPINSFIETDLDRRAFELLQALMNDPLKD